VISPGIDDTSPQIDFRAGPSGVVPYYRFKLLTEENKNLKAVGDTYLTVIVGPRQNGSVHS